MIDLTNYVSFLFLGKYTYYEVWKKGYVSTENKFIFNPVAILGHGILDTITLNCVVYRFKEINLSRNPLFITDQITIIVAKLEFYAFQNHSRIKDQ